MKIKICGMKNPENLAAIAALQPDYLGFIFYPESKRFMSHTITPQMLKQLPKNIQKTGVFVDANEEDIVEIATRFSLDAVQLHGSETVALCRNLRLKGFSVIKVFPIQTADDLEKTKAYKNETDYFLFDTKGELPGGNGFVFDWKILKNYSLKTPYFLSGGIGIENMNEIQTLHLKNLVGIDANSKLEIEPGLKDIKKTKLFINTLKKYGNKNI